MLSIYKFRVLFSVCLCGILAIAIGCEPKSSSDKGQATDKDASKLTSSGSKAADSGRSEKDSEQQTQSLTSGDPRNADDSSSSSEDLTTAKTKAKPPTIPESLAIGDVAPQLWIDDVVLGDNDTAFKPGRVQVVEFWATWCGPCRQSMPHLSELQNDYKDQVRFVGITREDKETVSKFLDQQAPSGEKTWRDELTYTIALDRDDVTSQSYMRAANQNGIPTAFIVGQDSHVEWIGHPMMMEEVLAKVVAKQWDRAAARAEFEEQQRIDTYTFGDGTKRRWKRMKGWLDDRDGNPIEDNT